MWGPLAVTPASVRAILIEGRVADAERPFLADVRELAVRLGIPLVERPSGPEGAT